ncbi:hypothetical protein POM88_021041 [Heracleum sosnowskyi]|uniref:Uncharacterized protein n=1 Tax=Heracleum sosnowskyi TaxID=360622 RepID=A0AAD8IE36_9APIA|nr:hypothetical protein POM88_021041 [Heracleum sosnowskyi]
MNSTSKIQKVKDSSSKEFVLCLESYYCYNSTMEECPHVSDLWWKKQSNVMRFVQRVQLLDSSSNAFWKTGWIYARLRHRVAFVYDGQVVLDTPLLLKNDRSCKIFNINPIAVSASEELRIVVKGSNIAGSNTRLLCALEGKYLVQEDSSSLIDGVASFTDNEEEIQSRSFLCSIPDVIGRGFIEVTLLPSLFLCSQHV